MKIILTALCILTSVLASAQTTFSLKAGATHNYLKGVDFGSSLGYYSGFGIHHQEGNTGFGFEAFFADQFHKVGDFNLSVQTINLAFGPDAVVSPTFPMTVQFGAFAKQDIKYRVDGEKIDLKKEDIHVGVYAGVSYNVNKFDIQFRFFRELKERHTFQLGIGYRLFNL